MAKRDRHCRQIVLGSRRRIGQTRGVPRPHHPVVSAGLRGVYVLLIYSNKSQKF